VTTAQGSIHQAAAIKSIVLHRVRVPFVEPFRISNGVVAEKESILIEVTNTDDVTGWGESAPMAGSFYSADTPDSSWQALTQELIPRFFESRPVDPYGAYQQLQSCRAMLLRKQASMVRFGISTQRPVAFPSAHHWG
jgi:O-succinylbenzoate synthase